MNLTPWFPADVQPVHVGVYEVEFLELKRRLYAHWDGRVWGWWAINPATANSRLHRAYSGPTRGRWRGIAAPSPKAA